MPTPGNTDFHSIQTENTAYCIAQEHRTDNVADCPQVRQMHDSVENGEGLKKQ